MEHYCEREIDKISNIHEFINNFEIFKHLVVGNKEINCKDINGKVSLMYALENGDDSLIDYLLNHGAKITEKNKKGKTILYSLYGRREI